MRRWRKSAWLQLSHQLTSLPEQTVQSGQIKLGGDGGVLIQRGYDPPVRIRVSAGRLATSFATELTTLNTAVHHTLNHLMTTLELQEKLFCADSLSAALALKSGWSSDSSQLVDSILQGIYQLTSMAHVTDHTMGPLTLRHSGKETADDFAAIGATTPQEDTPVCRSTCRHPSIESFGATCPT